MGIHTLSDLPLDTIEGTTADKQDVTCIHVDIVLVRVLTTTFGRHVHHRSFQQFQQTLLHTFTTHITGDRRVIALAGYLINLINEYDTTLCSLHIIVSHLKQTGQDTLHILAYITSFSKHGGINDGERYIKQLGNRTSQQGLTRSRRTHHNDVALLNLHSVVAVRLLKALIVIID